MKTGRRRNTADHASNVRASWSTRYVRYETIVVWKRKTLEGVARTKSSIKATLNSKLPARKLNFLKRATSCQLELGIREYNGNIDDPNRTWRWWADVGSPLPTNKPTRLVQAWRSWPARNCLIRCSSSFLTASGTVWRPCGVISATSSSTVTFSKPRLRTISLQFCFSWSRHPHSTSLNLIKSWRNVSRSPSY